MIGLRKRPTERKWRHFTHNMASMTKSDFYFLMDVMDFGWKESCYEDIEEKEEGEIQHQQDAAEAGKTKQGK